MITWTSLTPRALKAVVEGRITREDVREAFHRMEALMAGEGKVDLLADVRGQVSIELAAIGEEMRHLSIIGRMLGKMDRVALVADPAWIRDAPWRDAEAEQHGFAPSAQHPSLIWPEDRAWVLVSEIDYDSTIVAGSAELIRAICADAAIEALPLPENADLTWTADEVNR